MFDALSDRLERISTRLRGKGRISEADLEEALGDIRTALLEADVELSVARRFCDGIRLRVSTEELSRSLTPGQQVIKAVHEELVSVLGGESLKISYASRPPTVVLMAGLQGSGKTTASAKLALWWKQQGRNPILIGADLQRPAAVEQLRILGAQAGVTVFSEPTDPVAVARAGVEEARRLGKDVAIIDTAGRLTIDAALMEEIRGISDATEPHYTFLVIDAMIGQDAVATASAFHRDARTGRGDPLQARRRCRAAVRPSPSKASSANRSRSPAQGSGWPISTCSIPTGWPTGFSAWATSSASSSRPSAPWTTTRWPKASGAPHAGPLHAGRLLVPAPPGQEDGLAGRAHEAHARDVQGDAPGGRADRRRARSPGSRRSCAP